METVRAWLDIRSLIGYSHDVPEYRWQLVPEMDAQNYQPIFRGRQDDQSTYPKFAL
jgi:hypothetical protein